jgi:hypothetical protein
MLRIAAANRNDRIGGFERLTIAILPPYFELSSDFFVYSQ